jgi:hypothetical protein
MCEEADSCIDIRLIKFIAEQIKTENSPLSEPELLNQIEKIVRNLSPVQKTGKFIPLVRSFLSEKDFDIQSLFARLLDKNNISLKTEVVSAILGKKACTFLYPYLFYTHAGYSDLLLLKTITLKSSHLLDNLIEAEKKAGKNLLRRIIAQIGWSRLNYGFEFATLAYLYIDRSPPFVLNQKTALLFNRNKKSIQQSDFYFIIAHGGLPPMQRKPVTKQDPITRFRAFNLIHAELLTHFLDVSPLSARKVTFILKRMKKIVSDYVWLFKSFDNECPVLTSVYDNLRERILTELNANPSAPQLSANLTRLIQAFEDPHSLAEVHTLHGLKRYLHQKGLSLGFRLVGADNTPNRTVDLVVVKDNEIQTISNKIRYADFESTSQKSTVPYPVHLLISGFASQFFHGQKQFPYANIFCYGNEVHYYFSFRNHPAFLRIDYSPPLRGGMIDLEYSGVSNYDLNIHPNISLEAIRILFQRLEFDFQINGTRIHARYDKERSLDLEDLCQKAALILSFTPYLMDLDWIIGSLSLANQSRRVMARAWADFFYNWGWLPVNRVLSVNRRAILIDLIHTPSGVEEIIWDGTGEYKDMYTKPALKDFLTELKSICKRIGLEADKLVYENEGDDFGQIAIKTIKPCLTPREMRLAYLPGASFPCKEIKDNPAKIFQYTAKGNLVGMITNGTAIAVWVISERLLPSRCRKGPPSFLNVWLTSMYLILN